MSTLKILIQNDFIIALKAKDSNAKTALNSLKAKITEAEKVNNTVLSDDEIIKVISKAIKQREESQEIYENAGRAELAKQECDEACVLRKYLPSQLSNEDIRKHVAEIFATLPKDNINKLIGMTTGTMNKRFTGQFDNKDLQAIIKEMLND